MIWDRFFLTRATLVLFYTISAIFWLVAGLGFEWRSTQKHLFFLLFLFHSLGMTAICAGFFGQRKAALLGTLVVGLMWFAAIVILLKNLRPWPSGSIRSLNFMGMVNLLMVISPGFALFFITWLLLRNSRQVPEHFREF
jgi:hypothetical protein